jgi:hypothetical protein
MESDSFLNFNIIALGIIAVAIFVIVAIQIKSRKSSKFLHLIKEKFFGGKKP